MAAVAAFFLDDDDGLRIGSWKSHGDVLLCSRFSRGVAATTATAP